MARVAAHPRSTNRRAPARSRKAPARPHLLSSYREGSQTPLTALLFVLPLLVLHEVGVQWYGAVSGGLVEYRITAFTLLMRLFHAFGASGRYLPAMAVVAVLLSWHIARRDRWVFNMPLLPLMVVESILLALPLVGVYFLFSPVGLTYQATGEWKLMASLYLGAGVYEELVFRLAAFSVLSFLVLDLARIRQIWGVPIVVIVAAGIFSAYHMLGFERFGFPAFVFIALRGVYYGAIFLERGFGITVGVHTAYDLIFLALKEANGH
jgi:hypothetical protein